MGSLDPSFVPFAAQRINKPRMIRHRRIDEKRINENRFPYLFSPGHGGDISSIVDVIGERRPDFRADVQLPTFFPGELR
jgi:hypothetical protein